MPKLVAAFFFAALGWFGADLVKPLLPEGTRVSSMNMTLAAFGVLFGWKMVGARAGDGIRSGMGLGLTTAMMMLISSVFSFAGYKMLQLSIKKRYDGPMEAIQAFVEFGIENLVLIAVPGIAITVIVGGMFGGWLTERTAARWN